MTGEDGTYPVFVAGGDDGGGAAYISDTPAGSYADELINMDTTGEIFAMPPAGNYELLIIVDPMREEYFPQGETQLWENDNYANNWATTDITVS